MRLADAKELRSHVLWMPINIIVAGPVFAFGLGATLVQRSGCLLQSSASCLHGTQSNLRIVTTMATLDMATEMPPQQHLASLYQQEAADIPVIRTTQPRQDTMMPNCMLVVKNRWNGDECLSLLP